MNKLIAIAINEYSDPLITDLNNCINDANGVIDILSSKYQFSDIEILSSKESTTLVSLYQNLYDQLINAIPEDSILIYFAGHGEYNEKISTSYWLCSDSSKYHVTSWFSIDTLNRFFNASEARHIALISDSCFSGAIFEKFRGGGSNALESKISRQALTSGGLEKVLDGKGKHSLFNLSLQKVLNTNDKPVLSFYELSEQVILDFDKNTPQTPTYGSLIGAGHEGGTFLLKLQKTANNVGYHDLQLTLDLPKELNISSDIKVPFFNQKKTFNNTFVNSFIQSLGYTIVNEVRNFAFADWEYAVQRSGQYGFEVLVDYSIEYLDEKLLSIKFSHYSEMGGAHPNHYVYALNFCFSPDRNVSLYDAVEQEGHQNFQVFLNAMIEQFAHSDDKNILKACLKDSSYHDLPFSFTKHELTIYWFNQLPHAFKGHGILIIPVKKIDKISGKIQLATM
jgi:hypothetical protein